MKKILAVFVSVAMVFSLTTASAFAAEALPQGQVDEGSLGHSDLTYIDKFGLAVGTSIGDNPNKIIEKEDGWHALDYDLNHEASWSDYVYLGYHTNGGFPVPADYAKPITGLLVVTNVPDPLKDPQDVVWQGKTYHPVLTTFDYAKTTLDLNSGVKGHIPRYLYYTNDGWDTGAPILTGIEITSNYNPADTSRKLDYVYSHDIYGQHEYDPRYPQAYPADLRGASGTYITPYYLLCTYHKHDIEYGYDETEHWITCTKCDYKVIDYHSHIVTNVGGYHRISCSGCEFSKDWPHVDGNHDGKCDFCDCRFVVRADNLYFGSFVDAWAYAVEARRPVTITLLETVDANTNSKGESVGLAIPMLEGPDITIESDPGAKLIVSQDLPILMWNGTLKINAEVESVCEDSTRIFAALLGKIILGKNGNITLAKATSPGPEIISGLANAPIMATGAGCIETEGGSIVFLNHIEGSAGISMSYAIEKSSLAVNNTTIIGADTAISIGGDVDAIITDGRYDAGDGCALKVRGLAADRTPEVRVVGGEFTGATCVDTDVSSALSIGEGIFKGVFTGKNVTECMAEGTFAAEIDEDGNITKQIAYQTLKDAGESYTFTERTRIGPPIGTHTITVINSGNGIAKAGKVFAAAGEEIELTAKPDDDSFFVEWLAEGIDIENDRFTMPDRNVKITAVFGGEGGAPVGPMSYDAIQGEDSEWTKGSGEGIVFASDAPFDKFICVIVDDVLVDASGYRAWSGSTCVELAPAFLETLSLGEHMLTIVSSDGCASMGFTVNPASVAPDDPDPDNPSAPDSPTIPNTGDGNVFAIFAAMLLAAVAGFVLVVLRRRAC